MACTPRWAGGSSSSAHKCDGLSDEMAPGVHRLVGQDGGVLGIRLRQLAAGVAEADVRTAVLQASLLAKSGVLGLGVRSEAPLVGDDDVLATRELVLASAESLDDVLQVGLLRADGEDDLSDVDARDQASRLSERWRERTRGRTTKQRSVGDHGRPVGLWLWGVIGTLDTMPRRDRARDVAAATGIPRDGAFDAFGDVAAEEETVQANRRVVGWHREAQAREKT